MGKLADFLTLHQISATVKSATENPNIDDGDIMTRHFTVTLIRPMDDQRNAVLRVPFSQGSGHTEEPTAADVLDCLASDSAGVENINSFDEWAKEYGFESDSLKERRKAERTYNTCVKHAERLREFLGDTEVYEELLWKTERK